MSEPTKIKKRCQEALNLLTSVVNERLPDENETLVSFFVPTELFEKPGFQEMLNELKTLCKVSGMIMDKKNGEKK